MRFPIDVVFIDAEQIVMRVEPSLRPFKTASCRGAREVVELAAGECERRGLAAGDRVAWASRSTSSTRSRSTASPSLRRDRRGTVLVASADQRFVKLARFLLEGRGIAVGDQTQSRRRSPTRSPTPTSTPSCSTPDRASATASARSTPSGRSAPRFRSCSSPRLPAHERRPACASTTSGRRRTRRWMPSSTPLPEARPA